MKRIDRLIKSTKEFTKFRKHDMKPFRHFEMYGNPAAESACKNCGRWVQVLTHPAPNDVEIGGPAIALDCGDRERVKC